MIRHLPTPALWLAGATLATALATTLTGCAAASDPSTVEAPPAAGTSTGAATGAQEIDVTVTGGTITPAPHKVKVKLGTPVRLVVHADVADEVHVHGYDLKRDITGGVAEIDFTADTPGVFEVELEQASKQLLALQVS